MSNTAKIIHLGDLSRHGATPEQWAQLSMIMGHTEDLLPVVSNQKAPVSPGSSLAAGKDGKSKLGKVPSKFTAFGDAVGFADWPNYIASDDDIDIWSANPDYGIFMQCRDSKAIDADINDPEKAEAVRAFINEFLQIKLPCRSRANSAKFLLALRVVDHLGQPVNHIKRRLPVGEYKGQADYIEYLANGNGYVVCGRHPSGVHYEWLTGFPPDFPAVSEGDFERLWTALEAKFGTGESIQASPSVKREKLHNAVLQDPVAKFLVENNLALKKDPRDGRIHIKCPWQSGHTDGAGSVGSTTYYPANTGGYANGHFDCRHSSCIGAGRTDHDFKVAIGYESAHEFEPLGDSDLDEKGTSSSSSSEYQADAVGEYQAGAVGDNEFEAVDGGAEKIAAGDSKQGKPTQPKFHGWEPYQLLTLARPVWTIKKVLPKAQFGVIFGPSGSGKTFATLDMALHIALGIEWRGHKVRRQRITYVATEGGAANIGWRIAAWCQLYGHDINELAGWFRVIDDIPNLMNATDKDGENNVTKLAHQIRADGGADIVIIDTFAQATAGANESSSEDMGTAMKNCKGIGIMLRCMVIVVHHSGKDESKGARGWSGLRAACDFEAEVVKLGSDGVEGGADGVRCMRITKLKDGDDGQEFGFLIKLVPMWTDEDGDVQEYGVARPVVLSAPRSRPKGEWQEKAWEVIQEFGQVQRAGIEVGDVVGECLRTTAAKHDKRGTDRRGEQVKRAINELAKKALIEIDNDSITIL